MAPEGRGECARAAVASVFLHAVFPTEIHPYTVSLGGVSLFFPKTKAMSSLALGDLGLPRAASFYLP